MHLQYSRKTFSRHHGLAAAIAALCFGMTGCATIISGQYQPVTFNTQPEGALVRLNGVDFDKTPVTISMKRTFTDPAVQYSLEGYQTTVVSVPTSFNAVSLLDILFWPSFFVDAATGSMMSYAPPFSQVTLQAMAPVPAIPPVPPAHP